MKTREMLIVTMFLTAATFSFSVASFYRTSQSQAVIKRFVSDMQLMDIEPDEVGK